MKVWIIVKEILEEHQTEIVGVYSSEDKAKSIQEKLSMWDSYHQFFYEADPVEYIIEEWSVQ